MFVCRRRGWARFGLFCFSLLVLLGCADERSSPAKSEALQLAAEGNDSGLVSVLARNVWASTSDIDLLIAYCEAQFQISNSSVSCRLDPRSESRATQFASALWSIWTGHTAAARADLERLREVDDWSLWGETGLLELAYHTEDHVLLARLLDGFARQALVKDPRHTALDERYRFILSEETANWAELEQLLSEHSYEEISKSPFLFSSQAHLFFARGQRAQLGELLRATSSEVQRATVYLFWEADYLAMEGRAAESASVLRAFYEKHRDNRRLAREVAFADAFDGSSDAVSAAFQTLDRIAETSRHDVKLLLNMAITLALYRQPEHSESTYRRIDTEGTNLEDFTALHVLRAWNAVYRGDLRSADTSLRRALRAAPRHLSANYLKALIAKRQADSIAALESLQILFETDPYNENFNSLILYFRNTFHTADWELLYQESAARIGN